MSASIGNGLGEELRKFQVACSTLLMYDSNVGQSPDNAANPAQGSMVATVSPSLQWATENSAWTAGLSISAGYSLNFDNENYNGTDYSAAGSVGYDGGRWNLNGDFRESYNEGQNRYYGATVAQFGHGFGLGGAFILSPKTSLTAGWNSSWTEPDGGFGATESHSVNLAAMWRYSPLLQVGPGIGWTRDSGDTQQGRDSLGPSLKLVYQLSRKVSLSGNLQMQFASYDGGGSDHFMAGGLTAAYVLNQLWAFNLSLNRSANASGAVAEGFQETTGVRLGVSRKLLRATLGLGLGYEHSAYTTASQMEASPDTDYTTADLSLAMPVWKDHATGTVFVRYNDSASNNLTENWSGTQVGCSLNFKF